MRRQLFVAAALAAATPFPGWWLQGGGGLADFVIDQQWRHVGSIHYRPHNPQESTP